MRGSINGIWLTKKNGEIHSAILPNLSSMVADANANDFSIVFWTNLEEANSVALDALRSAGIIVKDHSECQKSIFYSYFLSFLNRGIAGDTTALALASDILRFSILELMPDDEYYVYTDPNDIFFLNLSDGLANLDAALKRTKFGFSFVIEVILANYVHTRNGLLAALKKLNRPFFDAYFTAYKEHLENTVATYFMPTNLQQAYDLAVNITNQVTTRFFIAEPSLPLIKTTFGDFEDFYPDLDFTKIFPYERKLEFANTWLPPPESLVEFQQHTLKELQTSFKASQQYIKDLMQS